MTTDLLAQLRAYGRHLESEMTPLEVDEAAAPLVRKAEAPIRSRRWVVALVPAAILVILVPILLVRDAPPSVITGPDVSLSRGSVAFSGPGVGDADIFVTREGVGAQRIVGSDRDGFDQTCPRFSPDGTKLAYVETHRGGIPPDSIGGGPSEVVVVDFDGGAGAPELFRAPSTWRGCPTWSPDSTRVAYVVENPAFISGMADQWLVQVATLDGEITSLFDDFSSHFALEWSPDGTNIAVRGADADGALDSNRVWIVPVDGGLARLVADVAGCEVQPLAWSPDGSKIVIGDGEGLDGSIRIVDIDGSGEVSIPASGHSGGCDDVAWSPNGAWLAYTDGTDGRIVLVSPDGDDRVKLPAVPLPEAETPYYVEAGPVWSSDSTSLLIFVTNKSDKAAIVALAVDPDTPSVTFQHWDDWEFGVDYMGGLAWQSQRP